MSSYPPNIYSRFNNENIEWEALSNPPRFSKINVFKMSTALPKCELLKVSIIGRTANNQSCTIYTLFDSRKSHEFVNISFTKS
jgi:hypothetical protein